MPTTVYSGTATFPFTFVEPPPPPASPRSIRDQSANPGSASEVRALDLTPIKTEARSAKSTPRTDGLLVPCYGGLIRIVNPEDGTVIQEFFDLRYGLGEGHRVGGMIIVSAWTFPGAGPDFGNLDFAY